MNIEKYTISPSGAIEHSDRPHLTTATVKDSGNISKLKKVVTKWTSIAEQRMWAAKSTLDRNKVTLAQDSELLTQIIKQDLHKESAKTKVYISYDDHKKIQGVAIARIHKSGCNELKDLATHPQNLKLFKDDTPIRGVGTSLVVAIAKDVRKRKKGCKKLHLEAVHSAVPFYEKLGFTVDPKKK